MKYDSSNPPTCSKASGGRGSRRPDTQSTSRAASPATVQVGALVVPGEPVVRGEDPEQGVAGGVDHGREPPGRGVPVPVGVRIRGPTRARPGSASRAAARASTASAGTSRSGLHTSTSSDAVGGHPPVGRRAVPEVLPRVDHLDPGRLGQRRRQRPVRRPVVDHHDVRQSAGGEVGDAPGQGGARLVVDDHCGGALPGAAGHGSIRVNRYLIRARSAPMPSRQVIFLPSLTSRPA